MKITKEELAKIVEEELQKEGLFDFFRSKKKEPEAPAPEMEPEGPSEEELAREREKAEEAYKDALIRAANMMKQSKWQDIPFRPHPKLNKLIGHTWFPEEIEKNRTRPWMGNFAAWEKTLEKTFPMDNKKSIEYLDFLSDSAEKTGLANYRPPETRRDDEPLYQDVYGGGMGGRLASLSSMEESKTNDTMVSLMENWRKFEQREQLSEASLDNQTSFKIFAGKPEFAAEVMQGIMSGGPLFKQLQAAQGKFAVKSPELVKQWVDSIGGIDVFAQRAAAIGSKIPDQGLSKKDMPFLPGPEDAKGSVSDVEDALKPGGKYNVDIVERTEAPAPNTFVGMDQKAQKYMKSGLDDGDPNDDSIDIKLNGKFAAAEGIPTQTNILFPKALGMAMNGVSGGNLGAYASTKGHILDGHHRWAATMLNDPTAEIGTFAMIDMEKGGMSNTLKHLTAIGNALGNKTKDK